MKLLQEKIVIGAGVFLIILPFTGFPSSWKTIFTVFIGVVLAYIGALIFKRTTKQKSPETKTETFTQVV
jgi:CDP-diglyceride synthetase